MMYYFSELGVESLDSAPCSLVPVSEVIGMALATGSLHVMLGPDHLSAVTESVIAHTITS